MPTFELDISAMADDVIRSINIRWLSVPSMNYDSTNGWHPVWLGTEHERHETSPHQPHNAINAFGDSCR